VTSLLEGREAQSGYLGVEPLFEPGSRVRARGPVRNDGTFPGASLGDVLVPEGAVGYVRDVGTFLQRYYVYAVDFIESGRIVGMLGRELAATSESTDLRAP
jgi:nitrogen fixation protein NifZ